MSAQDNYMRLHIKYDALQAERDALKAEVERLRSGMEVVARIKNELNAQNADLRARNGARMAEVERLRAALTPSGETKAAYMGEFEFDVQGERGTFGAVVPWTTIKDIMAAISKRAALRGEDVLPPFYMDTTSPPRIVTTDKALGIIEKLLGGEEGKP